MYTYYSLIRGNSFQSFINEKSILEFYNICVKDNTESYKIVELPKEQRLWKLERFDRNYICTEIRNLLLNKHTKSIIGIFYKGFLYKHLMTLMVYNNQRATIKLSVSCGAIHSIDFKEYFISNKETIVRFDFHDIDIIHELEEELDYYIEKGVIKSDIKYNEL